MQRHIMKTRSQFKEEYIFEKEYILELIGETYGTYIKHGSRSCKKVDFFHRKLQEHISKLIQFNNQFEVKLEYIVESCNSANKKRCDIVMLKNNKPHIIFPVKIIMTNYKQNKNNSWENLTGEIVHLKWSNPNINIIPINIFMNNTPYLTKHKLIKHFENVSTDDISIYNKLVENGLCHDIINYITDVEHKNNVGEIFNKIPIVKQFNKNTNYRTFESIISSLIN